MNASYRLLRSMPYWLAGMCLLIAPMPVYPQKLPDSSAPVTPTEGTAKRVLKTEREKYTALRDAKRLSQKAETYEKQGKTNEAERMAEEALVLEEQVRGAWHIEVAHRLDQVADLYTAHKKEAAAEPLYERATAIRERALSTHPDVYDRDGRELHVKPIQPADKAAPTNPTGQRPPNRD